MTAINDIEMHVVVGIIGSTTSKKKSKFHNKTAYSSKPFSYCLKEATKIFNKHLENKTIRQSDL